MKSFTRDRLTFPVRDGGPVNGQPVVLLHGFPQDSRCWDEVVPHLHAAGLRTLAPDQRGHAVTARPRSTSAYRLSELAGDVVALLDAAGLERAHVVGHDWGGGVAWAVAATHPDRVASLTVLSTPHPSALRAALSHGQLLHSGYMAVLATPVLPVRLLGAGHGRLLTAFLRRSDAPSHAVELARELVGDTDRFAAMLRWYRAVPMASVGPVAVPTTYAWSTGDPFLGRWAAEHTGAQVTGDYRFVVLPGLSHWLLEQAPDVVARLVLDRVRSVPG